MALSFCFIYSFWESWWPSSDEPHQLFHLTICYKRKRLGLLPHFYVEHSYLLLCCKDRVVLTISVTVHGKYMGVFYTERLPFQIVALLIESSFHTRLLLIALLINSAYRWRLLKRLYRLFPHILKEKALVWYSLKT